MSPRSAIGPVSRTKRVGAAPQPTEELPQPLEIGETVTLGAQEQEQQEQPAESA